jgi:hypothetical protein
MTTILGLDLREFKSVACAYDPATTAARFVTVPTDPQRRPRAPRGLAPASSSSRTRTVTGWVTDPCGELGLDYPSVVDRGVEPA